MLSLYSVDKGNAIYQYDTGNILEIKGKVNDKEVDVFQLLFEESMSFDLKKVLYDFFEKVVLRRMYSLF
jgi:hypothetical protein